MYPIRIVLKTYPWLMETDPLICDLINAVSPAAAAVIAIDKIWLSTAMKWRFNFMCRRKRFARCEFHVKQNGSTTEYPFRKTSRTYQQLMEIDLHVCDPIVTATATTADTISFEQLRFTLAASLCFFWSFHVLFAGQKSGLAPK